MAVNIFKSRLSNASAPQCAWLYTVQFGYSDVSENDDRELLVNCVRDNTGYNEILSEQVNSITLPQYSTKYWTANCLGTKRSYAVGRDYSGESTMTFQVRDRAIIDLLRANFGNTIHSNSLDGYIREEFEARPYNKIIVKTHSNKIFDMEVARGEQSEMVKTRRLNLIFTFENVIPLDVSFSDLSYTSEEAVTCTLKFHYDYWTVNDWAHVD